MKRAQLAERELADLKESSKLEIEKLQGDKFRLKKQIEALDHIIDNYGVEGVCTKCKEHTQIGDSCCGDDYVHIN